VSLDYFDHSKNLKIIYSSSFFHSASFIQKYKYKKPYNIKEILREKIKAGSNILTIIELYNCFSFSKRNLMLEYLSTLLPLQNLKKAPNSLSKPLFLSDYLSLRSP